MASGVTSDGVASNNGKLIDWQQVVCSYAALPLGTPVGSIFKFVLLNVRWQG
jgi:hypothetical protein